MIDDSGLICMASGSTRANQDGSFNIRCKQCGRLVGRTSAGVAFSSVSACAVCYSAEQGEVLAPDTIAALDSQYVAGLGLIPKSVVDQASRREKEGQDNDPLSTDPSERLGPKYWLKVAGLVVKKTVQQIIRGAETPSQKLARAKRKQPLFTSERELQELINQRD